MTDKNSILGFDLIIEITQRATNFPSTMIELADLFYCFSNNNAKYNNKKKKQKL